MACYRLQQHPSALRNEILDTGIVELPLDGQIAIAAVDLNLPHRDPADRFIVATAIAHPHNAILLTADRTLLAWEHALKRHDAAQ